MKKLTDLLSEVFDETPKVDKHQVVEGVKNFGIVGQSLYNNNNIMEVAKQLAQVAESAHHHILGEESDWFDKISVNRNMKQLKGNVMEFQKTAQEAHALNQRLTSLYEDIGHVLNRYYEIDEVMNEGDTGDRDNDGINEPDDEEYLQNKRTAITKAVKGEAVGNPDNRDMVNKPDSPSKEGRDDENSGFRSEGLKNGKGPAKDGNDNPDQYAASEGEEMNETSPGHRTGGENDPDSGDGNDSSGEEIRETKKRPFDNVSGVVGIPALGDLLKK